MPSSDLRPRAVPLVDPEGYSPSVARPVRAKARRMEAAMRIDPHQHPWGQVVLSATGVIRMSARRGEGRDLQSTYIVPPSRAVWVPPRVEHVVTVVADAEIRTLYIHPSARFVDDPATGPCTQWTDCRVLEVSSLLREASAELDTRPGDGAATERERLLSSLVLDELKRATPVPLGVDLPSDRRLRALCDAVIDAPTRWDTLGDWARQAGASPRTLARLFRSELGTSFVQWRRQVLLAHALSLSARHLSMARIAGELGYASPSAFSAMVRRTLGAPPKRFFA